ncbi:MAG: biotin/lipoyl-containing protein, partial [Nakamurella sp.]
FVIDITGQQVDLSHQGRYLSFARPSGRAQLALAPSDGQILAPMPGAVVSVNTLLGKQVTVGDVLGVLEAMKMEHALTAPLDGVVTAVAVQPGDQVTVGQALFTIAADG